MILDKIKIYSDRKSFIQLVTTENGPSLSRLCEAGKNIMEYDSRKTTSKWDSDILQFETNDRVTPPPKHQILFIGSSSIRKWDLEKWFPDLKTINRGFGGSHIAHTNRYLHRIAIPYEPETIILYAGDNDLSVGKTPEALLLDIAWFIWKIKLSLPGCFIKIISLKPSPQLTELLPKIVQLNTYIQNLCKISGINVQFINVFPRMLTKDQKPDCKYFESDGLHLNEQGYNLWTEIISKSQK